MPCRNDGYEVDCTRDVIKARDEAAAVACECIKAMLQNDGYDLHDLPAGAEAWFRGHRERDKREALMVVQKLVADLKVRPRELREADAHVAAGYLPSYERGVTLKNIELKWQVEFALAEAREKLIKESDPMDLKHGLY